jgi:hypothetical protein
MWEIYSNSYCTLAATASFHTGEGLFRERPPSGTIPCRIYAVWEGPDKGLYDTSLKQEWTAQIVQARLNQRGWVFQERMLSRRTLHFTAHQIYWNCEELCASETYPTTLPLPLGGDNASRSWDWYNSDSSVWTSEVDCFNVWHECVRYYSHAP